MYNGLYKRTSEYVRAAEYLDNGSPFMQRTWATAGTQILLLNQEIRDKGVLSWITWLVSYHQ